MNNEWFYSFSSLKKILCIWKCQPFCLGARCDIGVPTICTVSLIVVNQLSKCICSNGIMYLSKIYSKISYNNLGYSKMFTGTATWNIPRCFTGTTTWNIPRCFTRTTTWNFPRCHIQQLGIFQDAEQQLGTFQYVLQVQQLGIFQDVIKQLGIF